MATEPTRKSLDAENTFTGAIAQRLRDLAGISKVIAARKAQQRQIDAVDAYDGPTLQPQAAEAAQPKPLTFKAGGLVRRGWGKARGA